MRLLLDTHLLLWGAAWPERLPPVARLVAQATHEGITLLTADTLVSQYPGPIQWVGPAAS